MCLFLLLLLIQRQSTPVFPPVPPPPTKSSHSALTNTIPTWKRPIFVSPCFSHHSPFPALFDCCIIFVDCCIIFVCLLNLILLCDVIWLVHAPERCNRGRYEATRRRRDEGARRYELSTFWVMARHYLLPLQGGMDGGVVDGKCRR